MLVLRDSINPATISLAFLLVVLLIATAFGSRPALLASVLATVALNFLFLPPFYTFTIADPQNWISLAAFVAVALTVGYLSSKAKRRAEEAERLYVELQEVFDKESEAEAVKRSEKMKSALLDAVTHDLRTPLTSIKASVTMLIEEHNDDGIHVTLDPEGRGDLLNVIDEESDRLNAFVESMVELARFESGSDVQKRSSVTPEEIVTYAVRRFGAEADRKRIRLEIEDKMPRLDVDSRAISEALYNLVENAMKYSFPDTVITVGSKINDGKIRFWVEDIGNLIPLADRENIFLKFFRSDQKGKGFGMGLSIVRAIVESHEGRVWAESGRRGNKFVIELPHNSNGRRSENTGR